MPIAPAIDPEILKRSPFFQAFRQETRVLVAGMLRPRTLVPGELLFDADDHGETMFVVLSGLVQVVRSAAPGAPILDTFGPGAAVGEMALLLGESRGAACRAIEPSIVGVLDKGDLDALLAGDPGLALALGRLVAQRLRRTNEMTVPPLLGTQMLLLGSGERITLGHDPANQVVLTSPLIADWQVEITRDGDGRYLARNLEETNGVRLAINSRFARQASVVDGDILMVGPYRFIVCENLGARDEHVGSVWLTAESLSVVRNGATLLHDISLSIRPGEFVAIAGASGAGKTTLLNALNGFQPAGKGRVMINGVSLYDTMDVFRRAVGYVPQDDIVHPELSVARAFHFTARLRLPTLPAQELLRRLDRTLQLMQLVDQHALPIGSLSGGQRKRASIGVELITEPSLFCLDEPTSGLDPSTELRIMALLRQISQRGQTVLMVTHASETIGMCDRVIFLTRGGRLAFSGSPLDALTYFQVSEFNAIYNLLSNEHTPEYWQQQFLQSPFAYTAQGVSAQAAPVMQTSTSQRERQRPSQFLTLLQRYLEILRHDMRTLLLVSLQAPLIGLLMWIVFPRDVFSADPQQGHGRTALMIVFVLMAAAIFFGASNASKELVKERAIFRRERLVNLRLIPYLFSKVCVLGVIGVAQSVVLVGLCWLGGLIPTTGLLLMIPALIAVLSLVFLAGMSLGLLLSAIAANADFATSMVPLVLLPQLMFSGLLVPPPDPNIQMSYQLSDVVARVTIAKWAFELIGHVTGLIDVLGKQNSTVLLQYQQPFAAAGWWPQVVVLVGLSMLFLGATLISLAYRARLA